MSDKTDININIKKFVNTIVNAALSDGLVPEAHRSTANDRKQPMIVVAAAPKSGSTFLANTLCKLTDLSYFRLCSAYSTNEHDLYLPALSLMEPRGCVSQLHIKGTYHNAALMKQFGIRPIILVRNIYDTIVSLLHDLREKHDSPNYESGINGYSFFWQDESIRNLDDEALIDSIIDLAIPWYVNFYASWYRLCGQGSVDALWVTYEELFNQDSQTLKKIMTFLNYDEHSGIDAGLFSEQYGTFRSGTSGEGSIQINDAQKMKVQRLFSHYSDIDFGKYGIQKGGL